MMKLIVTLGLVICTCLACLFAEAQENLVPNPSFEKYIDCPDNQSQVERAHGWSIRQNTPDFYHFCGSNGYSTPSNNRGNQCSSIGQAYCGLYTYVEQNPGGHEFIGRQLSSPLTIGQKYYVSLKISLADYATCATNNIGALFSTVSYGDTIIVPSPLIKNHAHIYNSKVVTDSVNWTIISGSFVADSAYQYITIGNFFDDLSTDTILIGFTCWAYYFIEDICVSIDSLTCVDIKNQIIDFYTESTNIEEGSCISYGVNTVVDYDFYNWQFDGATPNKSTDSMPSNICYDTAGTYPVWLIVSDSSGCPDTIIKNEYITVSSTMSFNENDLSDVASIYPNPTMDILFIELNTNQKGDIYIYNISGKLIEKRTIENNIYEMDLSEQAQGVYFISIIINESVTNKKILLIR